LVLNAKKTFEIFLLDLELLIIWFQRNRNINQLESDWCYDSFWNQIMEQFYLNQVKDFKYLGTWIESSSREVSVHKAKVWSS
jgi:hypothetical protein